MNDSPLELAGLPSASMPCAVWPSLEVVGPDDPLEECLAASLKACLKVIEYRNLKGDSTIRERIDVWADAIEYARKAVELGSKLQ